MYNIRYSLTWRHEITLATTSDAILCNIQDTLFEEGHTTLLGIQTVYSIEIAQANLNYVGI